MFITLMLAMVQETLVVDLLGGDLMELLKFYTSPVKTFWAGVPEDYQLMAGVGLVVITLMVMLAKCTSRTTTTLSRKQKRQLLDKQEYVKNVVKSKKKSLYSEYLQQTVSDQDL